MGSRVGIGWKMWMMGGFADACDDCSFTVNVMDVILASIAPMEYLLVRRMNVMSDFIDLFPEPLVDDGLPEEDLEEDYLDMETTTRIRN